MSLKLYIANRTFSSWSLRAWLVLGYSGQNFDSVLHYLDEEEGLKAISQESPTGLIPFINHDGMVIGDTLAIAEYIAEDSPHLWPSDRQMRAEARAVVAFIHSGVSNLRSQCPMNLSTQFDDFQASKEVQDDLDGLERLLKPALNHWQQSTNANDNGLYQHLGIIDAFLTPIASRVHSYHLKVGATFDNYLKSLLSQPLMLPWLEGAKFDQTDPKRLLRANGRYGTGLKRIGEYHLIKAFK